MKKALVSFALILFTGFCLRAQVTPSDTTTPNVNKTAPDATVNPNSDVRSADKAEMDKKKDQVKPGSTKYYYYPESNVYFNEATGNYSYFDPTTKTWNSTSQLPTGIIIDKNTTKTPVFYNGMEVWKDNEMHQKKYSKKAPKN